MRSRPLHLHGLARAALVLPPALLVLGLATPNAAANRAAAIAGKQMRAVRTAHAPAIDGHLTEPSWQTAQFVDDFRQKFPDEGARPSRRTEVAVLYDDDALYVGARMYADGPDDIQAVMTRRDESGSAERIIISFDTFRDHRTAYSFALTAAGVRVDWFHPTDQEYERDYSWNPVWQGETAIGDTMWTAEMRIPFSQLRFIDRTVQEWGINLNRFMPQDNEDVFWVAVPRSESAWSSYFGSLVGLQQIDPPRRIEIMPYLAADTTLTSGSLIDNDNPFSDELALAGRGGVDLKMGLGPNLTLDATFNPDFGQVEADPAVVNLSAFETFFAEQRPFFTEGSQLLTGTGPSYFNSRRIGQAPRGYVDDPAELLDYVTTPESTRIWGASKLTGRLPSGLSIGALTAVTGRTYADTYDRETDTTARTAVEPLTEFGVFRAQQELGNSGSLVGLSFTNVYRDLDHQLASQRPRQAYTGGADWDLRLRNNRYGISGFAGFSVVNGEPAAMQKLQLSSTHYLQRPDQDHVTYDPELRTMAGMVGGITAEKRTGSWLWNAGANIETPGFELNDVGHLNSADELAVTGSLQYRDLSPGDTIWQWNAGLNTWQEWNTGGMYRPSYVAANGSVTWANHSESSAGAEWYTPGNSDTITRGGPVMRHGTGWGASASHRSRHGARTEWELWAGVSSHETLHTGFSTGGGLSLQPSDRWKVSIAPRYDRRTTHRQYVATIQDANATATYGARYLFAAVDRAELVVQLRFQYTFTPNLALAVYGEPFASSGAYRRFGELAAAGSKLLREYEEVTRSGGNVLVTDGGQSLTLEDPNFTILSLRSTAVIRWDFLPGSSLFVVWQQNRAELLSSGHRADLTELGDSFTAPGSHTLALKLTYWWPVD